MSLSFIKTWIFDLDNTLYPPEENIFSQIDEKMTSFIAENLKISHEEAFNIQKQNFIDHGTTLAGFMNTGNNKINPDKYNGASLIGVNGISIKSHGDASPYAFSYALDKCYNLIKNNFNMKIRNNLTRL